MKGFYSITATSKQIANSDTCVQDGTEGTAIVETYTWHDAAKPPKM